MHLNRLDLNLLTALHALLDTGSVTQAADRVGRTQSAMSHALGRLRHHFGDPLLVRDGWSMRRTPLAERLLPLTRHASQSVTDVFRQSGAFDPATSHRRVRIAARDVVAPLFTPFVAKLAAQAPGVSVEFVQPESVRSAVQTGIADIGLAFGSVPADVALTCHPLTPMHWATFAPCNHPFAKDPSIANWAAAHHIVVGAGSGQSGPVAEVSQAAGVSRTILASADSFTAALVMAGQCHAVFSTLAEPLAPLAQALGMVTRPVPFEIPPAQSNLVLRTSFGDPFATWIAQQATAIQTDAIAPA